jgi:hypothetical protein
VATDCSRTFVLSSGARPHPGRVDRGVAACFEARTPERARTWLSEHDIIPSPRSSTRLQSGKPQARSCSEGNPANYRGMEMRVRSGFIILIALTSAPADAANYYSQKLFDFPDGKTSTQGGGCIHHRDVPSVTCSGTSWRHPVPTCHHVTGSVCDQWAAPHLVLERRDVILVVSGPNNVAEGIQRAVEGYVAGCVAVGMTAAASSLGAVATAPAAPGAFWGGFQGCMSAISVSGTVGAVLHQLSMKLDTSQTHWAPL